MQGSAPLSEQRVGRFPARQVPKVGARCHVVRSGGLDAPRPSDRTSACDRISKCRSTGLRVGPPGQQHQDSSALGRCKSL
eukprot:7772491-Alexandrium_andersonii.AAC.1